jgi:hypothetical protein
MPNRWGNTLARPCKNDHQPFGPALEHYNTATLTLNPLQLPLKWDEVVEYVFLSNFDLLRDAC